MEIEDIDKLICERIEFAASKKREGVGTTGSSPVFWSGFWQGQIQALQILREKIHNLDRETGQQ